jgi:hypothetical protein
LNKLIHIYGIFHRHFLILYCRLWFLFYGLGLISFKSFCLFFIFKFLHYGVWLLQFIFYFILFYPIFRIIYWKKYAQKPTLYFYQYVSLLKNLLQKNQNFCLLNPLQLKELINFYYFSISKYFILKIYLHFHFQLKLSFFLPHHLHLICYQ